MAPGEQGKGEVVASQETTQISPEQKLCNRLKGLMGRINGEIGIDYINRQGEKMILSKKLAQKTKNIFETFKKLYDIDISENYIIEIRKNGETDPRVQIIFNLKGEITMNGTAFPIEDITEKVNIIEKKIREYEKKEIKKIDDGIVLNDDNIDSKLELA